MKLVPRREKKAPIHSVVQILLDSANIFN